MYSTGSRGTDTLDTASDADDGGSFTSSNIAVAAYVAAPLLGFALLLCFCARRRRGSRDAASARTASHESWVKDGAVGGTAAVSGVRGTSDSMNRGGISPRGGSHMRNGSSGSAQIVPMSSSMSAPNDPQVNRAQHTAVGGVAGASGRKRGGKKPRPIAESGTDTAFSMTDDVEFGGGGDGGGGGSDSSRGAGTGRSASPAGYDEDMNPIDDDAAASVFCTEGRPPARAVAERGGDGSRDIDDDLSENGWGSVKSGSRGLPAYAETQPRDDGQWKSDILVSRASSNRERNSDRALSRAAAHAGRKQAIPRHSDDVLEAAMAVDGESRRTVSMR